MDNKKPCNDRTSLTHPRGDHMRVEVEDHGVVLVDGVVATKYSIEGPVQLLLGRNDRFWPITQEPRRQEQKTRRPRERAGVVIAFDDDPRFAARAIRSIDG